VFFTVSESEPMLLWEVRRAGSGSEVEEGVSDPRLIEQPDNATAISATQAGPCGEGRETPECRRETGLAISLEILLRDERMIQKSVQRFSEKIMRKKTKHLPLLVARRRKMQPSQNNNAGPGPALTEISKDVLA
jgi:hypothetical protein